MDLDLAMKLAWNAQRVSREILLNYFGKLKNVERKYMAGLVSEADKDSETAIIKELEPFGVLVTGEEESFASGSDKLFTKGQTRWLIDPLDGTTNYVHGFPIFCTSIGLEIEGEVVLSLIDVPMLDKTYTAIKGQGAFCNNKKLEVSDKSSLSDALGATGFFAENKEALERQLAVFTRFVKKCRGIRRAGAAAFDLCMVAEGVFDVFWEENLQPWDTAAGFLLVTEAGGQVTTYTGDNYAPESKNILATNKLIHKEALSHF